MEVENAQQQVNQGNNLNQSPPSVNPITNQKGNFLLIIGVVVLVLVIGAGAYYLRTRKPATIVPSPTSVITSPTPQVTPTSSPTDETANWKTYTSEDASFSFKYPSDWIYEAKKSTLEIQGKKYNATSILAGRPLTEDQRKAQGYIDINNAPKTYNDFSLAYATHADFTNLSADNLVEELIKKRASEVDNPKTLLLTNNIQAKEVGYGCQAYCIDVLFRNNNAIFDASTGPNAEANIATLRQILSTLKFTN